MEKKIMPTMIHFRKSEIETIFVDSRGDKKHKKIVLFLLGFFLLGSLSVFAAEPVKKESVFKQIGSVEKRGVVNFFSSPAEIVYALKGEMKDHPKVWPATCIPQFFMNMVIRVVSSANDIVMLPIVMQATNDATPLTSRFDLPDYAWEKT